MCTFKISKISFRNKVFTIIYATILLFISSFQLYSQSLKVKEIYSEGEEFFNEKDYKEALFSFLQVFNKGTKNANLQYKIGFCYLNIENEEYKAIPYLEEAVKSTTLKYKNKSITEDKAPLYAYFYLGTAYRIDNQLDKALKNYYKFRDSKYAYNVELLEKEIMACERAKFIFDAPVDVSWEKLPETINTPNSETRPVISGDGNVLVYLTGLKFYNAIFYTRNVQGQWLPTENINPQVLSDGEFYPTALSYDGKELYMVKVNTNHSDIYVSYFKDLKWTPAKPLNDNINSLSDENSAAISTDGKYLYFSSNRKGGKGGFDIYRSEKTLKGDWGKAENLGKIINTKEDEVSPSLTEKGNVLFFSSAGHYNMGGFDVFRSTLGSDGKWEIPVNVGYPINTTNNNIDLKVIGDGKTAYYAKQMEKSTGSSDIYIVEIKSKFIPKENSNPEGN